jgi:hypothetical protein
VPLHEEGSSCTPAVAVCSAGVCAMQSPLCNCTLSCMIRMGAVLRCRLVACCSMVTVCVDPQVSLQPTAIRARLLVQPNQPQLYLSLTAGCMHGEVTWTVLCHMPLRPAIAATTPQVYQKGQRSWHAQDAGQCLLLFCFQSLCRQLGGISSRESVCSMQVRCQP